MAVGVNNISNVGFLYKRHYLPGQVTDAATRDRPLFKMVKKIDDFTGTALYYTMRAGNPASVGTTFSTVQTNAATLKGLQFAASRAIKYGCITIDGQAMLASRDNAGAFAKITTEAIDAAIDEVADHIAFDMYRAGKGVRGRIDSAWSASNTFTMTPIDDARNFKVDMVLRASANANGTSMRTGTMTVTAVDEDTGTFTADYTGITSLAASDYLYQTTDEALCMNGLAAHLPLAAPTSGDSFNGVDRSVDVARYAGSRVDDTATNWEENAGLVAVKISNRGKKADHLIVNPQNMWVAQRRLGSQVCYDSNKSSVTYGFETMKIASPAGMLTCVADHHCPTNRGYVLKLSTWELHTLGGAVHVIDDDGKPFQRQATADGIEGRLRFMGDLICRDASANGVFSI